MFIEGINDSKDERETTTQIAWLNESRTFFYHFYAECIMNIASSAVNTSDYDYCVHEIYSAKCLSVCMSIINCFTFFNLTYLHFNKKHSTKHISVIAGGFVKAFTVYTDRKNINSWCLLSQPQNSYSTYCIIVGKLNAIGI